MGTLHEPYGKGIYLGDLRYGMTSGSLLSNEHSLDLAFGFRNHPWVVNLLNILIRSIHNFNVLVLQYTCCVDLETRGCST